MKPFSSMTAIAAATLFFASAGSVLPAAAGDTDVAGIKAEISSLETEIVAAEAEAGKYQGGALAVITSMNLETLKLSKSVLEARLAAEATGAPIKVVVPAVQPDPEMAANILAEIQAQQIKVDAAKAEAAQSGGLVGALAATRYETERLSLSQLRQAWYRAQYGIAFPMTTPPQAPQSAPAGTPASAAPEAPVASAAPDWADPRYPEIDYSTDIFQALASQDFQMSGWWAINYSKAEIDDSPQVLTMNVSDYGESYAVDHPTLVAGCIESQTRLIFNADTYILSDYNSSTLPVTVRIDDAPAVREAWSKLSNSQGAGLFGAPAEKMIRKLIGKEKVFLRLVENNGNQNDLSIKLAGSDQVFSAVAEACHFNLFELSAADYKGIQVMLNAAGFDAGTPDGQWGAGSRAAMKQYQASVGLPQTGIPDQATLEKMGMSGQPN